ncbi:hypothetical protein CSAG_04851 [Citrobacter portucalensis]|nr:hypothetical protein CSAG_04851 [Citrobacter portucalensis]
MLVRCSQVYVSLARPFGIVACSPLFHTYNYSLRQFLAQSGLLTNDNNLLLLHPVFQYQTHHMFADGSQAATCSRSGWRTCSLVGFGFPSTIGAAAVSSMRWTVSRDSVVMERFRSSGNEVISQPEWKCLIYTANKIRKLHTCSLLCMKPNPE